MMKAVIRHIIWIIKGIKVYALVGKSGTGKSFRAKLIAQKYGIELIIDDGLLIKDQKILAGKSAKKEKIFLKAIRTALFEDKEHRNEVREVLQSQKFKRILIIGTSDKMIKKIISRLKLPSPSKVLRIEDVASKEEIETAILSRKTEGKHVIPVPAIEIHKNYPHIFYDSIKVFLKKKFLFRSGSKIFEKSVVRPEFTKANRGKVTISEAALAQMVFHCIEEYDSTIEVMKVSVKQVPNAYRLKIHVNVPIQKEISSNLHGLQQYIIESVERYAGIIFEDVTITIEELS